MVCVEDICFKVDFCEERRLSGGIRCFFLGEELVFLIVLWGRVGIKGG